ncbi:MAG: chemotaxis protein CheD [Hydrogenophaga sp.]|uniref:chemotaxis protein CheD n=1 Tax=Hydrogenophaga sp. TaxID=1904254 RepID=UPI003D9AD037
MSKSLALAVAARAAVRAPAPHLRVHTLHPGQVAFAERGEQLTTLLGSCVAVILTDARRTFGAMCHIVHAGTPVHAHQDSCAYGPLALSAMDAILLARGITPKMCLAYVYGGGNMFPQLYPRRSVGDSNAGWVLDALAERGVQVLLQDLGGEVYRRLVWTVGPEEPQVTSVLV